METGDVLLSASVNVVWGIETGSVERDGLDHSAPSGSDLEVETRNDESYILLSMLLSRTVDYKEILLVEFRLNITSRNQ